MSKTAASRSRSLVLTALIIVLFSSCSGLGDKGREGEFPLLEGDYLGQSPPGMEPEIFARGIISDPMQNRDVAITPDGNEMYFGLASGGIFTIIRSERVDGRWMGSSQ